MLKKQELVRLYAVIRQAELSLDRGLSGNWSELLSYYAGARLESIERELHSIRKLRRGSLVEPKRLTLARILSLRARGCICRYFSRVHLSNDEIELLFFSLKKGVECLKADAQPPTNQVVDSRMALYECEILLESLLPSAPGLKMAQSVEHFGEAPFVQTFGLDAIDMRQ